MSYDDGLTWETIARQRVEERVTTLEKRLSELEDRYEAQRRDLLRAISLVDTDPEAVRAFLDELCSILER
jgi:hypothetical protein